MNKRKLRLLNSAIACLGVCAIVFTISVFAATSENASVSSYVTFYHSQIKATVEMQIDNASGSSLAQSATVGGSDCLGKSVTIATLNPTDSNNSLTAKPIAVDLQTTGNAGYIYEGEYLTITYTITPLTNDDSRIIPMFYDISYSNTNSFFNVSYSTDDGDTYTDSSSISNSTAQTGITSALSVIFKLEIASTFCGEISNVGVGSFTIKLANSVANLNELT